RLVRRRGALALAGGRGGLRGLGGGSRGGAGRNLVLGGEHGAGGHHRDGEGELFRSEDHFGFPFLEVDVCPLSNASGMPAFEAGLRGSTRGCVADAVSVARTKYRVP